MASRILFITGTDTGVGKTVFAVLVTQHLRGGGFRVAALKPVCSGGRDDARLLRDAAGKALPLDEVNPWHFRAPLAPLLAARMEGRRVCLDEVVAYVRTVAQFRGRALAGRGVVGNRFDVIVVEGAGGLLSPLGEDFDSRDLIQALGAAPIIVCPNKLGAVNQVRLVVDALPPAAARQACIILVNPVRPDRASKTNPELLKEFVGRTRIRVMPWLGRKAR